MVTDLAALFYASYMIHLHVITIPLELNGFVFLLATNGLDMLYYP